jgi:hypothetical protein
MAAGSDKPKGRPFQPGQSGNPLGRGVEREQLRKYIREYGKESVDGIVEMSRSSRSEKIRLAAYIWLAEQNVGKAVQALSGPDGEKLSLFDFSGLTTEQLAQLEAIRAAVKVKP